MFIDFLTIEVAKNVSSTSLLTASSSGALWNLCCFGRNAITQLQGRNAGSTALSTNSGCLSTARARYGGTTYDPDEAKEHGPVHDSQHNQVEPGRRTKGIHDQEEARGDNDVAQSNRNKN